MNLRISDQLDVILKYALNIEGAARRIKELEVEDGKQFDYVINEIYENAIKIREMC